MHNDLYTALDQSIWKGGPEYILYQHRLDQYTMQNSQVAEQDPGSISRVYLANETNVTTARSTILTPAGNISRNARLGRETMPSLARR